MKSEIEIQRARDILVAVIKGEVPCEFPDRAADDAIHAAADVLCWVLQHDHNTSFQENLAKIEAYLEALGYRLREQVN